jgi:hypothetical protein
VAPRSGDNLGLDGLGNGVDGRAAYDTTGHGKLGASAAEEGIHLASTLATFVDAPRMKSVYCYDVEGKIG